MSEQPPSAAVLELIRYRLRQLGLSIHAYPATQTEAVVLLNKLTQRGEYR